MEPHIGRRLHYREGPFVTLFEGPAASGSSPTIATFAPDAAQPAPLLLPRWSRLALPDTVPGPDPVLTKLYVPLWHLAGICLAWPVTSLLLIRRRRKEPGFAIEPAAAPPAIDFAAHHASNIPPP